MNSIDIVKKLGALRVIEPDGDFKKKSRLAILQTPFTPSIHEKITFEAATAGLRSFTVSDLFSNTFRSVMIAVGTLGILAGIYFATIQLSPLFLPGLNQNGIVAEAGMVNTTINVQLAHITHFEQTSTDSSNALKEITSNAPVHLNTTVIDSEKSKINSLIPTIPSETATQQVNDILNEISK